LNLIHKGDDNLQEIESWNIAGGVLEYIDYTHTYIFNGEILPSITQILKIKFGNKYKGISENVLQRASELGIAMHQTIQNYEELNFDDVTSKELRNYKFLKKHFNWKVLKSEIPIIIFWNFEEKRFATLEEIKNKIGVPVACGRLDQLIEIENEKGINDLKRTSTFDKEYIAYQTNIYRIGVLQTYGIETTFVAGTHLREDVRKFTKLPINEEMALSLLEKYLESREV
jgi:hypothetical protein